MAKREQEDEPPPGAPDWVVTFSDMISLLVTFFVMLLSFSTDSKLDNFPIPGLMLGGRKGAIESKDSPSAVAPPEHDIIAAADGRRGAQIPHARPESELTENLAEMGQKKTDDRQEVDFRRAIDGLLVGFDASASFAPGSAAVSPGLRESLIQLAGVLQHYQHMIVVEGFTDSKFEPTPTYPTAQDLSAARAAAAAKVLVENSDLPAEVIQVAGLGTTRARGDESRAAGRALNRRVEVRILGLSTARAAALEALERSGSER
jgi:chemotaxis protein MotB